MFERFAKYGKLFAILYIAQALVGIAVGLYVTWSGSSVFGFGLTP